MTDRKQLKNLAPGATWKVAYDTAGYIHFQTIEGKTLFQVRGEDIFDAEGNRFDLDGIPARAN